MRFAAVLLAAGQSRRMGAVNKLALPVDGEPLLRRTALRLVDMGFTETVVVSGYREQTTRELLHGLPVEVVHNQQYQEGQMTSVHRGLDALRLDCDGVFVCLADQPLLETEDLRRIQAAFAQRPDAILVPTFAGRRGNPIVLPHAQRSTILAGKANLGCRRLIEKHPERVHTVEMDNDHCVFDLDTPAAYLQLQARIAAAHSDQQLCYG